MKSDEKNNEWQLAIIDEVYPPTKKFRNKQTNVIAHVKNWAVDDDYYYEALIPEFNYYCIFIDKSRIIKFL